MTIILVIGTCWYHGWDPWPSFPKWYVPEGVRTTDADALFPSSPETTGFHRKPCEINWKR